MTGARWSDIQKMEQARYLRLCAEHPSHVLCSEITGRGAVTQAEAAQLGRLATENNWPLPSVGRAAAKRRKARSRT